MRSDIDILIETVLRLAPFMILGLVIGAQGLCIWTITAYVSSGLAVTLTMAFVAILIANFIRKVRS